MVALKVFFSLEFRVSGLESCWFTILFIVSKLKIPNQNTRLKHLDIRLHTLDPER